MIKALFYRPPSRLQKYKSPTGIKQSQFLEKFESLSCDYSGNQLTA